MGGMRRVRRVRVVTRDHLEAFILLLQDEFRCRRPGGTSGGDSVRLGKGHNSRKWQSVHTCCGNGSANENSQLARDAIEKLLFIVPHSRFLDLQNPDCRNFIPRFNSKRDIILPEVPRRTLGSRGYITLSPALDGHKDMIRNNLQPNWISNLRT